MAGNTATNLEDVGRTGILPVAIKHYLMGTCFESSQRDSSSRERGQGIADAITTF